MDDDLVRRLRALESRVSSSGGIHSDIRVIEMQLARAEEKVLRLGRDASWTHPELPLQATRRTIV